MGRLGAPLKAAQLEPLIEQDAVRHERTLKRIEDKQEKLVQLYYQDLVTVDVFQREQHKLKAETNAAQRLRRIAAVQGKRVEEALALALERLEDIHRAYLEATPLERRMMNRAIFKHIEIGDEGDVMKSSLTQPYEAIAAWQPELGRPAAAAQSPTAPQKGAVRPSFGYADSFVVRAQAGTRGNTRENTEARGRLFSPVPGCSRLFPALGAAKGPQEPRCGPFCIRSEPLTLTRACVIPSPSHRRRNGHAQAGGEVKRQIRTELSQEMSNRAAHLDDRVEADVELAALDRAVVGALKAGVSRESFLAVALLSANRPDRPAELLIALDFLDGIGAP